MNDQETRLRAALRLTLMFYDPGPWDGERLVKWGNLLTAVYGQLPIVNAATTRVMCDAIRHALTKED